MPKKLPLYWPEDANGNKLRSKTLRVLRDRPNKLNSGSRRIQPLCDTLNNNKTFKEDKTEFHGFLSTEAILSKHAGKNKSRLRRSPLRSNKNQRSNSLKTFGRHNTWKKKCSDTMAVDFDHMYIDCSAPKISIGREFEYQHLKELNLLHLDLIQQQTEQLISKDKIIKSLKEENKTLRARLERIDRRVSLSLQKKAAALSPISVQTDFSDDVSYSFNVKSQSPKSHENSISPSKNLSLRNSPEKSPLKEVKEEVIVDTDHSPPKKEILRKLSPKQLSPSSQSSRISPRERRAKRDSTLNISDSSLNNNTNDNNNTSNQLELPSSSVSPVSCDRKLRSPTIKRAHAEEETTPLKKSKNHEPEKKEVSQMSPLGPLEEGLTNHSLRSSRNKLPEEAPVPVINNDIPKIGEEVHSSSQDTPNLPEGNADPDKSKLSTTLSSSLLETEKLKTQKGLESRRIRGDGILTTDESYYLPCYSSLDFLESAVEEDQLQVEIPKWRIKVLTSLYVMEGTENLEDEIFLKRHAKPEQDERRRKRWDLQRMREQRQYEKLRERYEGRNNVNGSHGRSHRSLWPNPESAQAVHVDNTLPVCAFGQPLAQISESDFVVPWLSGKTPLQVSHSSRRKKR